MKAKKHTRNLLYLFGAVFILGGIVTIFSAAHDMYRLLSAKHHMQVESRILSVRTESDWVEHSDTRSMSVDSKKWITEEALQINDQLLIYHGEYPKDPEGSVTHTVVSDDGIHWEVNDSSTGGTVLCIIVGVFSIFFGAGVIVRFA